MAVKPAKPKAEIKIQNYASQTNTDDKNTNFSQFVDSDNDNSFFNASFFAPSVDQDKDWMTKISVHAQQSLSLESSNRKQFTDILSPKSVKQPSQKIKKAKKKDFSDDYVPHILTNKQIF